MKRAMPFLLLLVLMPACTDSELQKVSKSMLVLANAVGEVQKDTISAVDAKLIDDSAGAKIVGVCARISVAGQQADAVIRSIKALDPQSRKSIVALLTPISQALDPAQLEFVAGIKDPATKQKIEGGFVIMRSAVSAIQLAVAAGGAQ
jgi:hypothetical protein